MTKMGFTMFTGRGITMRSSFSKRVAASAAIGAVALAGTGTVAMATSGPTGEARGAANVAAADQLVDRMLATGAPVESASKAELADSSALKEVEGDLTQAREIEAPAGGPAGETWVVIPAADGGACLSVDGAKVCGSAEDVVATGIAGLQINRPDNGTSADESPMAPGGTAKVTGFAPAGTVSVVAFDGAGKVSGNAQVAGQAYRLTVPTEGLHKVEYRNASGGLVSEKTLN